MYFLLLNTSAYVGRIKTLSHAERWDRVSPASSDIYTGAGSKVAPK